MRDRIFEAIFKDGKNIAPSFSEFTKIYERTDFSNVDKKRLNDIYLWGDDSSLFDKDKSLMQALNINTEDVELMSEIGSHIPTYSAYFTPDAAKKTKSIDLLNAQVELIKIKINQFENELMSKLTGTEEAQEYEPLVTGLRIAPEESGLAQELVNGMMKVFSIAFTEPGKSPMKPSINAFVASEQGKKLIKLLQQLGVRLPSNKVIDSLLSTPLKRIAEQDLKVPMTSADNTELDEINAETVSFTVDMNYMSTNQDVSELELMSSMDPFVRLGMFYQLCIQQQKEFSDQIMPQSIGKGVNFSDMIESGNTMEESIKVLFGRKADFSAVKELISSIESASDQVVKAKWSDVGMEELRTALFVPAMQVVYVSMLNFVIMKAMYKFLTKRDEIVVAASKQDAERAKVNQTISGLIIPDFSDPKVKQDKPLRYKTALAAIKYLRGQGFFDDNNKLYYQKGKEMNPEAITALKILVASLPQIQFSEKIPLNPQDIDGTWTPEIKNAVMQLQKTAGIKVDGIIGPDTRRSILSLESQIRKKYPEA